MTPIQLIASDLDGTLLNSRSELSEANLRAIQTLSERGIFFVPCTGRTESEFPSVLKDSVHMRYAIQSNGAVILDRRTNTRVTDCLDRKQAARVFSLLDQYEVHVTIRQSGGCYFDETRATQGDYDFFNVHPLHVHVLERYAHTVPHFDEWMRSLDEIEVISAFFRHEEEHAECKARMLALGGCNVAVPVPGGLEIFSKSACKGNALLRLAEMLGIERGATVGVGDSDNDRTLLESAGLSLAVSNATDALKAICDRVICSNDENAIDYIVSQYLNEMR